MTLLLFLKEKAPSANTKPKQDGLYGVRRLLGHEPAGINKASEEASPHPAYRATRKREDRFTGFGPEIVTWATRLMGSSISYRWNPATSVMRGADDLLVSRQ